VALRGSRRMLALRVRPSRPGESVHYNGTPPMITAMANGELEIAMLAFSTFPIAVVNAGMDDLRVIADEFQDGVEDYYSDEFMVLKDGPIKKVEDLKGKIVATNAAGSGVDVAMKAMLHKHGLEQNREYTEIEALPDIANTTSVPRTTGQGSPAPAGATSGTAR
jgi:sulfonate transport system substrate-binding protein